MNKLKEGRSNNGVEVVRRRSKNKYLKNTEYRLHVREKGSKLKDGKRRRH